MNICHPFLSVCTALLLSFISANPADEETCGYQACNEGKNGMINVHVVCHTHDDVGWVFTAEQYYRGYVRDILHSVIFHLYEDRDRRFVYVETAFLYRWWNDQSPEMKERVRKLVRQGRLEFVGGGWVMNDEAVTHYEAIIDQMTLGLRWLNDTFGACGRPTSVWQIDSFGHSREQASLFAQMNFHGLFLGRIDHQDIELRRRTKRMEFLWEGSSSLDARIFTGILPNVYWPPKGFCFDVNCWDEEITDRNAESKAKEFITRVKDQVSKYRTNHTIITMGMDFYYRYAGKWFRNLEKLIKKINHMQTNGSNVNIFFSTPACYLRALNSQNLTWSTESDDFLPYSSEPNSYWSGYFSSRPTLKEYSRRGQAFSQVCRQLVTFADLPDADTMTLQRAVAVLQHHDAITGTEKQHVANDYAMHLAEGILNCQAEVKLALGKLTWNNETEVVLEDITFCDHLNISQCHITEAESLVRVVAYNPLSKPRIVYLKVAVRGDLYSVIEDSTGKQIEFQVTPIPTSVLDMAERTSSARYELLFPAVLPALGTSTFTLTRHQDHKPYEDHDSYLMHNEIGDEISIENEYMTVRASGLTGFLESVSLKGGASLPLRQSFYYYISQPGFQAEKASGAYSFNPLFNQAYTVSPTANVKVYKGDLVEEIHQNFSSWVSQVVRLFKGKNYVELEWLVGPIPNRDYQGKEVVSRFETSLYTNATFFTDSNGRETMKRVRDIRPTWNLSVDEPVAGNYYPVTGWIYVKDEAADIQLTVLTDRAQGGSSVTDGSIELMVHRRCFYDDGYGVEEPLNELGVDGRGLVVRGRHWLFVAPVNSSVPLMREHAKELFHQPQLLFVPLQPSSSSQSQRANVTSDMNFLSLNQDLPPNVHLLNLELISHNQIVLRLEHYYESDDPYPFSSPARIALQDMFRHFRITSIRETTLSANQFLDDASSLEWNLTEESRNTADGASMGRDPLSGRPDGETETESVSSSPEEHLEVTLHPMQIRTFIATIERPKN